MSVRISVTVSSTVIRVAHHVDLIRSIKPKLMRITIFALGLMRTFRGMVRAVNGISGQSSERHIESGEDRRLPDPVVSPSYSTVKLVTYSWECKEGHEFKEAQANNPGKCPECGTIFIRFLDID